MRSFRTLKLICCDFNGHIFIALTDKLQQSAHFLLKPLETSWILLEQGTLKMNCAQPKFLNDAGVRAKRAYQARYTYSEERLRAVHAQADHSVTSGISSRPAITLEQTSVYKRRVLTTHI